MDPILERAIRADTGVWFNQYARIWPKDRSKGLLAPKQNYLQAKAQRVVNRFEELGLPVRIIQLKPRQKGSTTYAAALDYTSMRRKPSYCCIIGGQYSQTNELWDMISTYNANDKFTWGAPGTVTDSFMSWPNGSQLKAETANDRLAGIAGTYQILHATEVARWSKYGVSDAATVLTNILKCVPLLPDTMVILESTAEGTSGTYYERFIRALDAEDFIAGKTVQPGDFVRVFAPWFEFEDSAIRLNDTQKKEVERTLDAEPEYEGERALIEKFGVPLPSGKMRLGTTVLGFDVWEQLAWRRWAIREECEKDKAIFDRDYPWSWQDAFMKSGNLRLNKAGVAAMRKNMSQRARLPGIIEEAQGRVAFRQTDENEAKVIILEKPIPGRRYILSIDPMTGETQTAGADDADYHGVNVLREGFWDGAGKWNRHGVVAKLIPCRWDIDVVEEAAWLLARYYGGDQTGCKIVVEMNQDRGITELLKQRGADLYQREVFNTAEFKTTKALGYQTTPKTRERVIECLAAAVREYTTPGEGIDIWDEYTITQAENFVIKANGRSEAAEGYHDDELFSIGIGLLLIDHATTYFPNRGGGGLPPDLMGLAVPANPGPSAFS